MIAIALLNSTRRSRRPSRAFFRVALPPLVAEHECDPPIGLWRQIRTDEFERGRLKMYKCPECDQCYASGQGD